MEKLGRIASKPGSDQLAAIKLLFAYGYGPPMPFGSDADSEMRISVECFRRLTTEGASVLELEPAAAEGEKHGDDASPEQYRMGDASEPAP